MGVSWDTYWAEHEAPSYVNYTPQLLEMVTKHLQPAGLDVLEIGSGTGGNSSVLASLGARVTALDFSERALERTFVTAQSAGVQVRVVRGDTRCLPFASGAFDLVFHQGLLEHFEQPLGILKEQRRVLRPGGFMLVDVPQRFSLYTVYKHWKMRHGKWEYGGWETEFSLGQLTALLRQAGLHAVDFYGRGYYPRPFEMLHNLSKVETKVLKRHILPGSAWEAYASMWHRFERTRLAGHVLQSIGILAQAADS